MATGVGGHAFFRLIWLRCAHEPFATATFGSDLPACTRRQHKEEQHAYPHNLRRAEDPTASHLYELVHSHRELLLTSLTVNLLFFVLTSPPWHVLPRNAYIRVTSTTKAVTRLVLSFCSLLFLSLNLRIKYISSWSFVRYYPVLWFELLYLQLYPTHA